MVIVKYVLRPQCIPISDFIKELKKIDFYFDLKNNYICI